jgi:tetratricopeptide (TPR) repeat protein
MYRQQKLINSRPNSNWFTLNLFFKVWRKFTVPLSFLFFTTLVSGCFTKKEKAEKTSFSQNITTKFNILYNANKLLDEAEENRINSVKPNFQNTLPVFIEPNEASIASNTKLMDSIIQKSITIINDKSESKYINNAYFLMAKANYEKGNYYNAAEFFSYVINTITVTNKKLLEPALAWKARALMQIGYLEQASKVLDSAFVAARNNKHPLAITYASQARYYLEVDKKDGAIQMLELAINTSKNKKEKLRWHYILGQLLYGTGDYLMANKHFGKIVKSNASYEMAFNAELNQVFMQKDYGDSSLVSTVSRLKKMLRDDKNKGFTDQIYYIIGESYLDHNQEDEAIKSYKLSLREPSNNNYQRASTYLKIADIYFDKAAYDTSKHYYDSTATLIDPTFPQYATIQAKIENLDDLVKQLSIIAEQDQLQNLAKLPENERLKAIDSIFEYKEKAAIAIKKGEENSKKKQVTNPEYAANFSNKQSTDKSFYFNNPNAISNGLTEFKRRWGNRSLEDNWRIRDKQSSLTARNNTDISPTNAEDIANQRDSSAIITKEDFIEAVPLTEIALKESNNKIIEAYLKLAEIYRDNLKDQEATAKIYATLLERFPSVKEKDFVLYNLYRLYTELGDQRKNSYKNQLLTTSPESIYAKIINDPKYLSKLGEESQTLNNIYIDAYNLYADKDYQQVIAIADSLNSVFGKDNHLDIAAQMAYLKALAIGRTSSLQSFEQELKKIQSDYADNKLISPLVNQHLSYIDSNRVSLQDRKIAIMDIEDGREQFVDEPVLTKWPELAFNRAETPPPPRRSLAGNLNNQQNIQVTPFNSTVNLQGKVKIASYTPGQQVNSFRDLELLPDSAIYYFVINVDNAKVNLSPSRYGIGQFNRGQYLDKNLTHQLKKVDDELQLLYIGKFFSYEDAKVYLDRITPQLKTIMKIPSENYQPFIITEKNLGEITDFDKVNDYLIRYKEQL